MDETFEQYFLGSQGLDDFYQMGNSNDMPLSNDLLNGFDLERYQATVPGGLPSPNSSNPDLPGSGRQSPLFPSLSPFIGGYDGSSDAHKNLMGTQFLEQSQKSRTNTDSNTSNNHPSTNQDSSNASTSLTKTHVQQGESPMTSLSCTEEGLYQDFMAPSDESLCVTSQSRANTAPSKSPVGRITQNESTHTSIAPKIMNINTSSTSAPASLQHSPTSKPQHFVRNPSHLRHQIHPEPLQNSLLATTATEDYSNGQLPQTMSPNSNFSKRQEPNSSPSYGNYQNVHHSSNRPQSRQTTSAQHQGRSSPVLQNYQPFQESSLRSSAASNSGRNLWDGGQFQKSQYPEPPSIHREHSNITPYIGQHYVPGFPGNCISSYSPEQYRMQPSNSRNASFMSQGSMEFGFNGSSPVSIKREFSSPDSGYVDSGDVVSSPTVKSQLASPKPQKKRRAKQEIKNNDDDEEAVDPVALRTSELTNLDPTDHTNVAALIRAMHNTEGVEDNEGMQKTWKKIRKAKALRIKQVCVDLLNLTKQAQEQKGRPLGEKRSLNHYASFQKRFDALCETLTFQKTVCKHLTEPPYSYGVVDDPLYAKDRVKNNRRVNHQKAEAIRLGREHLGEKGQGKGKPTLKTKRRGHAQMEDSQDDEENSGDEPYSDAETDVSPHLPAPKSGRPNLRAPKRMKRSTNSTRHQEQGQGVQASYLPQAQTPEDLFAQDLHQNTYSPIQRTQMLSNNDRMLQSLAAGPRMPTLNKGYELQFGNNSGTISYGDNSTAGSDSDGLGAVRRGYN